MSADAEQHWQRNANVNQCLTAHLHEDITDNRKGDVFATYALIAYDVEIPVTR